MSEPFTTASGRRIDLYRPRAEDVDLGDIAEQLAKEARYNGATPGVFYSVAQHVVLGARWICGGRQSAVGNRHDAATALPPVLSSDCRSADLPTSRRTLAAYFLCHDFHEAYLKDKTTPLKRALDDVAGEFGVARGAISEAFARLEERHDAAIHAAAGLAWPPPPEIEAAVKAVDRAMLVTEWLALRPGHALPRAMEGVAPLPLAIDPWWWELAREALREAMRDLLPGWGGGRQSAVGKERT